MNGTSKRKRSDVQELNSTAKKTASSLSQATDPKKQWIMNAFAMFTPGHLSPGK